MASWFGSELTVCVGSWFVFMCTHWLCIYMRPCKFVLFLYTLIIVKNSSANSFVNSVMECTLMVREFLCSCITCYLLNLGVTISISKWMGFGMQVNSIVFHHLRRGRILEGATQPECQSFWKKRIHRVRDLIEVMNKKITCKVDVCCAVTIQSLW